MEHTITDSAIEAVAQYDEVLQNILTVQLVNGWLLAIIAGLLLSLIVMRHFK